MVYRLLKKNFGPPSIYMPIRHVQPSHPDVVLVQGFATGGRAMQYIARFLRERFALDSSR